MQTNIKKMYIKYLNINVYTHLLYKFEMIVFVEEIISVTIKSIEFLFVSGLF